MKGLGLAIMVMGIISFVLPLAGVQWRVLMFADALGPLWGPVLKIAFIAGGYILFRIGDDLE